MITVKREGILLGQTDLSFENEGVMNPAVISEGGTTHLFYRAVRKLNHSTIGYCRLEGPLTVVHRGEEPFICPEFDYECQGVEDPRIVNIDGTYYLSYTAYDGVNAAGALALSGDLQTFAKQGIITPQFTYAQFKELILSQEQCNDKYFRSYNNREANNEAGIPNYLTDKNLVFFPRKIDGKFYFMHRIKPDIQLVCVERLEDLTHDFWYRYFLEFNRHILLESRYDHESSYIGAGCPPIELPQGWLLIYHSVRDTPEGYLYSASAALMDLQNPAIEIARLPYPLFTPEAEYELTGVVHRVCFPTGTARFGDRLYIYYGAADKYIACASVDINELVQELLQHKVFTTK